MNSHTIRRNTQVNRRTDSTALQVLSVTVFTLSLSACGVEQIKTQQQLEAEVDQADMMLVVNRKLYVDANVRNSYFQNGYAQKSGSVAKYDPFCRFSINYENFPDADTTVIQAERMAVTRIRRSRNTAQVDQKNVATSVNELLAGEIQIDSWVTRFVLESPSQPWISGLDCEVFGSRHEHLSFDDIRETIHPSMDLISQQ